MGWTNRPPTRPGFYYWQGGRLTGDRVAVVQVCVRKDQTLPAVAQEMCIGNYKNAPNDGPAKDWGGRWAGPLPQPHELATPNVKVTGAPPTDASKGEEA